MTNMMSDAERLASVDMSNLGKHGSSFVGRLAWGYEGKTYSTGIYRWEFSSRPGVLKKSGYVVRLVFDWGISDDKARELIGKYVCTMDVGVVFSKKVYWITEDTIEGYMNSF